MDEKVLIAISQIITVNYEDSMFTNIEDLMLQIIHLYGEFYELKEIINIRVNEDLTIVHNAVKSRRFKLADYFIDDLKFNVGYYEEYGKQTLLHIIAKHYQEPFHHKDKKLIDKIIGKQYKFDLKNNFGRTVLDVANKHNCL